MADLRDVSGIKDMMPLAAGPLAIEPTRALFCQAAGDVTVQFVGGSTRTLTLAAGTLYPFCIQRFTAGTATVLGCY